MEGPAVLVNGARMANVYLRREDIRHEVCD
jgi:hypothetical protein